MPDELCEAKPEKNSSTLFTTETRSTRRRTENPGASVNLRALRVSVVKLFGVYFLGILMESIFTLFPSELLVPATSTSWPACFASSEATFLSF